MSGKAQHVALNPKGGWSVWKSGATRAARVFDTQSEAVDYARRKAKEERGDLFVHRDDGTIREMNSYGNDRPSPPKR
jgi:hypothetical protein